MHNGFISLKSGWIDRRSAVHASLMHTFTGNSIFHRLCPSPIKITKRGGGRRVRSASGERQSIRTSRRGVLIAERGTDAADGRSSAAYHVRMSLSRRTAAACAEHILSVPSRSKFGRSKWKKRRRRDGVITACQLISAAASRGASAARFRFSLKHGGSDGRGLTVWTHFSVPPPPPLSFRLQSPSLSLLAEPLPWPLIHG